MSNPQWAFGTGIAKYKGSRRFILLHVIMNDPQGGKGRYHEHTAGHPIKTAPVSASQELLETVTYQSI